ncbi:hypothetical protein DV515_00002179 [Chloebia gouldiae]|uniref:Uncharacterized protein n=1 Tax=Chloebia gouldiae TaxID=44316 RepID=A0A3L8SZQ0_CHLGU|nr:hypothetical protein DV515_00002179 [Chloebia gouldiae]
MLRRSNTCSSTPAKTTYPKEIQAEKASFIKLFTLEMQQSYSNASSFLSSALNTTPLQWYLCASGRCMNSRFDRSTLAKPKFS